MPLTRGSFEGQIQGRNGLVQVPRMIRWQFKMELEQVLKVAVSIPEKLGSTHYFYARIRKDG